LAFGAFLTRPKIGLYPSPARILGYFKIGFVFPKMFFPRSHFLPVKGGYLGKQEGTAFKGLQGD
jgi:hypothetical protein